jgi:hypothetical protein
MAKPDLPAGTEFVLFHLRMEQELTRMPKNVLPSESREMLPVLGTAMSALYQVATCHLGCRGGDHIIESLVGRSYNLAGSALLLIRHGYYDEALNLSRSIAEVGNLLSMFCAVPTTFPKWALCSRRQRLNDFSPAKVRQRIEEAGLPCLIDEEMYRELCEVATHVTPMTAPNAHETNGKRYIGGIPQAAGMKKAMDILAQVVLSVAMTSSKMVGQDKLFEQVASTITKMDSNAS